MTTGFDAALVSLAREVAERLERTGRQLVLAESCTAGLVAAALATVPGISRHLCGSAVVYQERTKSEWLSVPAELLADRGAVSAEVAAAMTAGVLDRTPYADLAAAVTGHLGPDAPTELDGQVYIAIQTRDQQPIVRHFRLGDGATEESSSLPARQHRQIEAAHLVLELILAAIR